ncbi:flavonoid 3'-monooxygenase-like [Rhodamnia argentea]|uniref:Flavonoid 3'-monooxygenase-like n=1 Tax=Rhodamnia argentea TaxID=178133 RepID=A0A8B8PA89_9MYRT|nr:flavonoid 3'-monooxygenase-like [Rhodamnia argentea]
MARLESEFQEIITEMIALAAKPNISDFYPGLARFDLQGIVRRTNILANRFDSFCNMVIANRLQMDEEGWNQNVGDEVNSTQDFLQYLLRLKTDGDLDGGAPFTMTQLKALLLDMVVGGTETSSNSVEFAMAEMIKNPEVMSKAQRELEQVVGKDNMMEESHLHDLPYLKAVMRETLRLHPALPLLMPHCPNETCLNFDPERFAGADNKWDLNGSALNYKPFGSSHRICPGTVMGDKVVLYSLATLVHSFEWKLLGGGEENLDVSEEFGINLKKKEPLVVIPTPRLSNPALFEYKMSIRMMSTEWMRRMFPKKRKNIMKLPCCRALARVEPR